MIDQIRAVADRVSVIDLRQETGVLMLTLDDLRRDSLLSKYIASYRRDALPRDFLPSYSPLVKIGSISLKRVIFFTSMPWRIPRGTATFACHPSRSGISTLLGWVMKRVMAVEVVQVLHRDLEAEVLRGLIADCLHNGIRDADMPEGNVLDVLRPDRREAGDRFRSDRGSRNGGRSLQ